MHVDDPSGLQPVDSILNGLLHRVVLQQQVPDGEAAIASRGGDRCTESTTK
jgi:hypothetical protein